MHPSRDDFTALLEESFLTSGLEEGSVIKGRVVAIEKDLAVIDVGLKTEGRVPLKEFTGHGKGEEIAVGLEVEVYLERVENALGEAVLSRDKARREEAWERLEKSYKDNEKVEGQIFNQVKGGYTVDLDGAVAFLPRSQVDIRPVRDIGPLMNTNQPFQILKMDRRRGNIVVSRRSVLEETHAERRHEIVQNLQEGQVVEGVVKNITDYGAFVDLGGIDGLLHVTDIAWRRINHPADVLSVGQTVKVQIIKVNQETHRISLGMKQLEADPWEGIEAKYPVGTKYKGRVTNITDYGAFVELEPGIEGLIHVSEMSWTKKNVHPGKIVSTSQEVEVMVLEVDPVKRRISLGLKQTMDNPWTNFAERFPKDAVIEGELKNITEFGLFIGLEGDVDGMVHLSDLDWNRPGEEAIQDYKKGDMVRAVVLDVDTEKERISLGIKQLKGDPFSKAAGEIRKGSTVTCEVVDVKDNGLEARIADTDLVAFIRRSDLSRERSEQRPERFAVGQKVDAKITQFDKKTRKITASIKALEIAEEKEAVAQYGSLDSGASLGDILGAALNKAQKGDAANEMAEKAGKAADKDEKPAKAAGKAKRAAADETEEPAAKDE
jgi:small subunit ribosomal protein S1